MYDTTSGTKQGCIESGQKYSALCSELQICRMTPLAVAPQSFRIRLSRRFTAREQAKPSRKYITVIVIQISKVR